MRKYVNMVFNVHINHDLLGMAEGGTEVREGGGVYVRMVYKIIYIPATAGCRRFCHLHSSLNLLVSLSILFTLVTNFMNSPWEWPILL